MEIYGKYQAYYGKITNELNGIKERFGYTNNSKAFAHWFLEYSLKMDEQSIAEAIIDGGGDNGIDAIVAEDQTLILFQFKFPEKVKNINKSIDEKTVLKIFNGYNKLVNRRKPRSANEQFMYYRDMVKEKDIFSYKMIFVSFGNPLSAPAEDALKDQVEGIKNSSGNEIKYEVYSQKNICDLYDRIQKKTRLDISMSYRKFDQSYNLDEDVKSFVGFTSGKEIIEACKENMDIIFDENIRLYEGDNDINQGIYETASSDESKNFFFYHNGIVMICDNCKNSTGNQKLLLEGASVVNGCQTINSLKRAYDNSNLHDDVYIQFRIIETSDFDLRAKITEYLNSQTKIKDSYFLANNTFIRNLQIELKDKGYFLERLANEYSFKRGLEKVEEYEKKKILTLEKVIQVYAAFYYDEYAARAKRGKGELFDKKIVEKLVSDITADKVIHSMEWYNKLSKIITMYRKCKRSEDKKMNFFDYIDMDIEEDMYDEEMKRYLFMNTADLLLLNTVANLEKIKGVDEDNEFIIEAIHICAV